MDLSGNSSRTPFRIAPTTPADLPGIAVCELLAFSGADPPYDTFSRLLYPFRAPLARSGVHPRHWPDFNSTIRLRAQNLRSGSIAFTAFVQGDDGKETVVGWARVTPPQGVQENKRRDRKWNERVLDDFVYPVVEKARNKLWRDADGLDPEFRKVFKEHQKAARERVDKDGQYYIFGVLFVHPSYQNRGVGSALLQRCMDLAAASSTPLLLESSPAAFLLYKKHGFVEIDKIQFTYKGNEIVMPCMVHRPAGLEQHQEDVMQEVDELAKSEEGSDKEFVEVDGNE